MTALTPGVAFDTPDNRVTVDGGLASGTWQFELTVIDNDGNASAPQRIAVQIKPQVAPPPGPVGPGDVFNPRRPDVILDPRRPDVVINPRRPIPVDPRVIIRRPQ
jgi:hypothetical protein